MDEKEAWKMLALARARILAAYRTGGRTPAKAIDDATKAQAALTALGIDWMTGLAVQPA